MTTFKIADDNYADNYYLCVLHANDIIDQRLIDAIEMTYNDDSPQNQYDLLCALTRTQNNLIRNYFPTADMYIDLVRMNYEYTDTLNVSALIADIDANI